MWAEIVGTAGVIVAGAGVVVTLRKHRRDEDAKREEVRQRLLTAMAEYRAVVLALPPLLQKAAQSHQAVLAAQGLGRSGNWVLWHKEHTADAAAAQVLVDRLPTPTTAYGDLDATGLGGKLVALRPLRLQADALKRKYEASLAADDAARVQIHTDAMARVAAIQARTDGDRN